MERREAIAKRAEELLHRFEMASGRGAFGEGSNAATLIDEVAEKCLGLEVTDWPHFKEGIIGKLDLAGSEICVASGLEPGLRAFTVAHEIGHAALDHTPRIAGPERRVVDLEDSLNQQVGPDDLEVQDGVYRAYNSRDALEAEANLFAAELLAPTSLILGAVAADPHWTPESLAERFGVSLTTMLTQLSNALLLRGQPAESMTDEDAAGERVTESAPKLDPTQRGAVTAQSPALVIAGPGAGKTRVLAERYAHLVREGARPESVLALTFSNKAAAEMRSRVAGIVGSGQERVQAYTFHSFCLETLKSYYRLAGLPEDFTLLTEADALLLIRRRLSELGLSHLEQLSDPGFYVPGILDAISRAKDELRGPKEFQQLARERVESAQTEQEQEPAGKTLEATGVYSAYQGWLQEDGLVDFGDLIRLTVGVLEHPGAGAEIRGGYDYVLVDEFQDINFASGRLLRLLDGGRGVVWAVADPDQSIYRFRGASPANLDRFADDYPGAQTVHLTTNYRSRPGIVGASQGLRGGADPAQDGRSSPPPLESTRQAPESPSVLLTVTEDRRDELDYVAGEIRARAERGVSLGDQAVLCSSNSQAREIVSWLQEKGLTAQGPSSILASTQIKDALAVISLLRGNDGSGLYKLCASGPNPLSEEDVAAFLAWAEETGLPVREALARCGEIDALGAGAVRHLSELGRLLEDLPSWGDPWIAVLCYASHPDSPVRALISDPSEEGGRRIAELGQLATLARSFQQRAGLVDGEGIRGFIEYVRELAKSNKGDAALQPPAAAEAVQVLTVHKSKGLEFPIVYVPNLARGRFPVRAPGGGDVPLPGELFHHSETGSSEESDRCLLYVALTRAEDELVMSRAEHYGQPKPPLALLDRLVREKDGREMVSETRFQTGEPGSEAAELAPEEPLARPRTGEHVAYGLRQLEDYGECPLKHKYGAVLGLRDGGSAYLDFRSSLYQVLGDMEVEAQHNGANPQLSWALERLQEVWQEEGPVGHFYEPVYYRRARSVVERWHASEGALSWVVRQTLLFSAAEDAEITVKTDAMARDEGEGLIIARHNFGRPRKSHTNYTNREALAFAAARQVWPERPVRVELQYPAIGRATDITPSKTVISNRTGKLTGFLQEARAGRYPANPGHACKSCPWNLICPASV